MKLLNDKNVKLDGMIELDNKETLTLEEARMFFNHIDYNYEVIVLGNDRGLEIKVPNEVKDICIGKLKNITKEYITYNKRTKFILS